MTPAKRNQILDERAPFSDGAGSRLFAGVESAPSFNLDGREDGPYALLGARGFVSAPAVLRFAE